MKAISESNTKGTKNDSACNQQFVDANNVVWEAYGKLKTFLLYQSIGSPSALKEQYYTVCNDGACDKATKVILSAMNGDIGIAGCDIL